MCFDQTVSIYPSRYLRANGLSLKDLEILLLKPPFQPWWNQKAHLLGKRTASDAWLSNHKSDQTDELEFLSLILLIYTFYYKFKYDELN